MTTATAWMLRAIINQRLSETVSDGLEAAIRAYYADYEDADDVDIKFRDALETLSEYGAGEHVDDLLTEVEAKITAETGRRFKERET